MVKLPEYNQIVTTVDAWQCNKFAQDVCICKTIFPSYKHGVYTEHNICLLRTFSWLNLIFMYIKMAVILKLFLCYGSPSLPMPFHIQYAEIQSQNNRYTTITIIWVNVTVAPANPQ